MITCLRLDSETTLRCLGFLAERRREVQRELCSRQGITTYYIEMDSIPPIETLHIELPILLEGRIVRSVMKASRGSSPLQFKASVTDSFVSLKIGIIDPRSTVFQS